MRQINILDNAIQFIDVDGTITTTPLNTVYTYVKDQTVSFILIDHRDNAGYVIMTSLAKDVQINGKVYTPQEYLDGTATEDFFSSAGIKLVVVDELPQTGKNGIIYLVANEQGSYTEYLWLEDEERFEELGDLSKIDLTNYYTKSEIDTMVGSINDVIDGVKDTIEANERIIASALVDLNENKADKSEIPDLTDYATKTYVDEAIAEIPQPDMSNYYTKSEIDTAIENNEIAIAAGFNDVNSRLNNCDSRLDNCATETYVDNAIAQIPQPDMSNYALVVDVEEMSEGTAAALVNLNHEIDILKSQIQTVNSRIDHYHTYRYVVQLSDVNTPGSFITLDDDIVTENVAKGTTYRVDVTRFLGDEYVGEDLVCGNFFLMLESEGAGITLNNCQFTTSNVDEQYYTLTFADDHNELTYDFTLAIS